MPTIMIRRRFLKFICWMAIVGLSLLPINVALNFAYKLAYDVPS